MNKKLLTLLLLAPIVFFAADKAIGHNARPGAKTAGQGACIEADVFEGLDGGSTPELVELATLSAAEQASLRKLAQEKSQALEEKYTGEVLMGLDLAMRKDERIGVTMREFLDRQVQAVMNSVDPFSLELEDEFSRCGSGYHYAVIAEKGALTGKGFLIRDSGCYDRAFGIFRVDFANSKAGVVLPGTGRMMSISDFLSLLAEA